MNKFIADNIHLIPLPLVIILAVLGLLSAPVWSIIVVAALLLMTVAYTVSADIKKERSMGLSVRR